MSPDKRRYLLYPRVPDCVSEAGWSGRVSECGEKCLQKKGIATEKGAATER